MVKLTGKYLKEERLKQNLNTAELSRLIGYKNVSKGMNRIVDLERENIIIPEVLFKIVEALNLDHSFVNSLIKKDRDEDKKEFEKWVSEPIKMYYVIRIIPAIYMSYDLPSYINRENDAINFVAETAREKHKKCCLVLSRKEKIFFDEDGQVEGRFETEYGDKDYLCVRVK